jgi:TP901 family phage tail tape measure protein
MTMATATKDLVYRIGADLGDLAREMEKGTKLTAAQKRELAALEKQQRAHRAAIADLGAGMLTFGAAVAFGLGMAGKAAIEWETAFTGVRKTVDGSDKEIAALEGELRQLARTLPATHQEIAAVAEAAGQLGIKRKDIAEFTKTMVDLGETTNLTAETAAEELAKFANIMGTSAKDVDRLGSALVALGNDGASTEADILSMGLRIAGAGKQIGLTEAQVLGFASALSSVGIEAEAGGSSMSTVMIKIAAAVNKGGEAVNTFAEIAGVSADQFSEKFRTDAAGAIIMFIQGLGKMQQAGGDVFGVLSDLGLGEIRVRDAMLRAGSAADMFTKSLQVGSSAWAENTALTDEANKRYDTAASKLQVAGNVIKDTLIDIGAKIAPIFVGAAQGASDMARGFGELPGPLKDIVTWVGTAAAGIALFGGAAAIAAPKLLGFRENMRGLEATGGAVGKGLGKLGLFLTGPWGAAIGIGVGLLGLLMGALGSTTRHEEDLATAGKSVAEAIRDQNGAINQAVRQTAAKAAVNEGLIAHAKSLKIEEGLVTDAVLQQGKSYDDLRTRLQGIMQANVEVDTSTGTTIESLNDQGKAAKELLEGIDGLVNGKNEELQKQKDTAAATKESTNAQKEQSKSAQDLAKDAEEAAKALDGLLKALNAINDTTLSAREAHRAYLQQLVDTAAALKENGKNLDINTEKGRANLEALDAQAGAANKLAEAAAREAESTGGAAAGAAALQASLEATRPALIKTAQQFGMNEKEAIEYTNAVLGIPGTAETLVSTPGSVQAQAQLEMVRNKVRDIPPGKEVNVGVIDAEARRRLEAIGFQTRALPDGDVIVTANTEAAKRELDALARRHVVVNMYVNPVINQAKLNMEARFRGAYGGIVSYAGGGIEDHRPQIARGQPGMVRVWAEEETDQESYIPWAMDRRQGATSVLATTADGFGYMLVPKTGMVAFGNGGVTGSGGGGGAWSFNIGVEGTDALTRALSSAIRVDIQRTAGGDPIRYWTGRSS